MAFVHSSNGIPVTLVGHPFATVGMGEQMRSHIAACREVHLEFGVLDIYRYAARTDPDHCALVQPIEIESPEGGIRIFHINGDEVEPVIQAFEARGGSFEAGYNIIVPAWELPSYPAVWAKQLRRFDEVWAISRFVADSLADSGIFSIVVGQPVEMPLGHFLPRKYFGIRESSFALLHFFDLSSYASRKNPDAVLAMFEAVREKRPYDDIQLVLKVKKGDEAASEWLEPLRERIPEAHFVSRPLTALETRSLINACDCFISLHRSEGFGRGTGEAMSLGRLAMATGWSGVTDYMTPENSLLVDYDLVPVGPDEYPFGEGQRWAQARLDHAVALLEQMLDDPERRRVTAAKGRRDVRLGYSYRAVGVRVLDRITEIKAELSRQAEAEPAAVAVAVAVAEDVALPVFDVEAETIVEDLLAPVVNVPLETVVEDGLSPAIDVAPLRADD